MTQGERVKAIRKELGLTLESFGEKLGVGKSAISNIEKGYRNLTEQMFKSICREFNVNEEWLRNGTEPMFVDKSREEEIASYMGTLLSKDGEEVEFQKKFIKALAKMDVEEWKTIQKLIDYVAKEK